MSLAPVLVELSDWTLVEEPTLELGSGDWVHVTARNLDAPAVGTVLERHEGDQDSELWVRLYAPDDSVEVRTDAPDTVIFRATKVKIAGA